MRLVVDDSVLVIIDLQDQFLKVIPNRDEIVNRSAFLLESANVLSVPVLATTQYADRMGSHDPMIVSLLNGPTFDKRTFSCAGAEGFMEALEATKRRQVILVGVETHICITQTAIDLLEEDYDVFLALDAVSSRTENSTRIGIKRLRDIGVEVCHSESVVYEWMVSSEHSEFKSILNVVKKSALEK